MKVNKVKFFGVMLFLTVLQDLVPFLGFITAGDVSVTTMHLPTILTSIVLGPLPGGAMGAVFGIISLFHALSRETAILDVLFLNPMISVVPRILVGIVPGILYQGLTHFRLLGKRRRMWAALLAAVVGSFTNTILVLGSLYVIYPREMMEIYAAADRSELMGRLARVAGFNGGIEAVCSAIVVVLSLLFLRWFLDRGKRRAEAQTGGSEPMKE